ncbi:MAG: ABC transporter ATP-binding protein [Coxiella endosymbiont of Haemaphysalis qinghaiensis]
MTSISTIPGFIWFFLKKQWLNFSIQFLLCFGWSVKESLFPFFIKQMVNGVHSQQPKLIILQSLLWQGTALFLVWIVMEISMRWQGLLAMRSFPQWRGSIRKYLFNYVIGHSIDYFNTHSLGSISSKISETPRACESLLEIVLLHVTSIGGATILSIILLWLTHIHFAILSILWLSLHLGISFYQAKRCHNAAEQQAGAVAKLNGKIVDVLANMINVLLFSRKKYESNYFKFVQKEELVYSQKARWVLEKVKIYQSLLAVFYLGTMLTYLITGWFYSTVSPGDFALVPILTFSLLGMIGWFDGQIPIIFREIGSIKASLQLLNTHYQICDRENAHPLKTSNGAIVFHDVSFHYPKGQKVFQYLFLSIPAKQKVGIVGLSGAGKSTLIRLLLRLYDVNKGVIYIDNQAITAVTQHSLRQHISVIPQECILFHRSIYENIRYGRLKASNEEVYTASHMAGCHDFIRKLPKGYQTLVGEQGTKLSGGQRQRIGIARTILKNSLIWIIDEATSAIDSLTEFQIQNQLNSLLKDKTTLIIAHRLTTLNQVDRIVIFDQGRIVGDGDKETLLRTNTYFQALYAKQYTSTLLPN